MKNYIHKLVDADTSASILLFKDGDYEIYWLGLNEESAFRVNVYLIKSGEEALLVDPGNRNFFPFIKQEIEEIMGDYSKVVGSIFHHQDPDVAASIVDWLNIVPNMKVLTTARTDVLLPFYGTGKYEFVDVTKGDFVFKNGKRLSFIESPFLHFAGAFTTYCQTSNFLFTSDIFAALDIEWSLVVEDFDTHKMAMDLFSKDYFASNVATRGYAMKIENLKIDAILPQHGSIIPKEFVKDSIKYLKNLQCGLDLIYPYLRS
jgi:flavorubredoxin